MLIFEIMYTFAFSRNAIIWKRCAWTNLSGSVNVQLRAALLGRVLAVLLNPPLQTWGGLALFHTVHRNLGLDGPSAFNCGLCGSILADVRVDVGRFCVAEGRAGWGQVNTLHFPKTNQKTNIASRKIVCGKSCVENCVHICQMC